MSESRCTTSDRGDIPALAEHLRVQLHARSPGPGTAPDELEAALLDIISSAQSTWPTIRVPPDAFVSYLGDRLPAGLPLLPALRQMHTADLYLACACSRGDVQAFSVFEERCLRDLDGVLLRMGITSHMSGEVKQDIRSRLLVGDGGRALIGDYSGRGGLRGWVRIVVVREVLQHQRRARREEPLEDDKLLQRLVTPSNPELDYMNDVYRREFKRAFEAALTALPASEQTLLHQHYVDAVSIDELGSRYRVHRSTAARLIARARGHVLEATRARMVSQLGIQPQDLDSILRMLRSRMGEMEVTLRPLRSNRKR